MFRNYRIKNFNFRLVVLIVALTIYGIIVIGSANEGYQNKQIIGMVLGLVVMVCVSLVDYSFVLSFHWIFYALTCGLLMVILIPGVGDHSLGATRWITFHNFRFQPSEVAKIFIVLFMAKYLMQHQENLNKPKRMMLTALLAGIPLLLIVVEPDLSTTIVTFLVIFAMVFYAGLSYKVVGTVLGLIFTGAFLMIFMTLHSSGGLLAGYQNTRIAAWLMPDKYPQSAMQQQNSIMAIGSGQLFGKGLNNSGVDSVKNGNYIPEPHTDFIFAVAGEELGFIGGCILVFILFAIAFECIRTAKRAKDLSGQLICVGMAALVACQGFVNVCVVTGLMPNTGLTLPFVSYGLTSLVALYLGMGFVLNVSLQAKKFYDV